MQCGPQEVKENNLLSLRKMVAIIFVPNSLLLNKSEINSLTFKVIFKLSYGYNILYIDHCYCHTAYFLHLKAMVNFCEIFVEGTRQNKCFNYLN